MKISTIYLYDEPSVPEIDISRLANFVKNTFSVEVHVRKNIFNYATDDTAKKIAACRIYKTKKPFEKHNPTEEEIDFEKSNIVDSSTTENIILYDGFEFQKIIAKLIPNDEATLDQLHIVFTNKLTCTFDQSDFRYHGRAVIGSNPTIISTTGIIEAPAKPREYYFDLLSNFTKGVNIDSVKKKYQGTYLEYHDQRLSKIIEGYLMQAIFYYYTGDPFCEKQDCRLFNAHWQKDLLYSQLEVGKLCERHQEILNDWKG
ncbi:MAG: DUF6775 family putative metallopeptidase [Nitrosopumilaceae archaeon]